MHLIPSETKQDPPKWTPGSPILIWCRSFRVERIVMPSTCASRAERPGTSDANGGDLLIHAHPHHVAQEFRGGRCPGDRPPSCQATQPRERELIFNVFRSAKGGFERFHRRLQRIAAGPVIRSAAAQGGKEERASARARAGPHPRGAAWQVGRRQRRCKTQWESGCKWRGGGRRIRPGRNC